MYQVIVEYFDSRAGTYRYPATDDGDKARRQFAYMCGRIHRGGIKLVVLCKHGVVVAQARADAPCAIADLERPGGCGAARLAILWTARSSNKKTGPMPVSTTSQETCAPVCPFKGNGCYAESGPLATLWARMTETGPGGVFQSGVAKVRTTDWKGLCASVAALAAGTVWRHNQAGDLPHKGGKIDQTLVPQLVRANKGRRGFTYTHHNVLQDKANAELVAWANRQGFIINLSANNLAHADQLADLGIAPVVVVLPEDAPHVCETPAGRKVVTCPATYREDVACITCRLCVRERDAIVGFPAHGARRRRAAEVVEKGA